MRNNNKIFSLAIGSKAEPSRCEKLSNATGGVSFHAPKNKEKDLLC